jgi:hypothetical protein
MPAIKRVAVRELRSKLKAALDSKEAIQVGTPWELRAVLIPIPSYNRWNADSKAAAVRAIQQAARNAIASLSEEGWVRLSNL